MEILQQMLPEQEAKSGKKSKVKHGLKRVLVLFIVLTIFAIIHTIVKRLSDSNFNILFDQMFNKMNSMDFLKNTSKSDFLEES